MINSIVANESQTFNWDLIDQSDSLYEKEGLKYALERKMQALRCQELPAHQLEDFLNSIPGLTPKRIRTTMELFTVGAQAIMKSDWKPNGGIGFKQTKGYESHRRLCAYEFSTRHNESRLFVRQGIYYHVRGYDLPALKSAHHRGETWQETPCLPSSIKVN
jgi:hypothetical protein